MSRKAEFLEYYRQSRLVGDVDPQNACLHYLVHRFELNEEQCFWLAFLFGCTYCAPTTFYIYNEFPDFENVDVGRLQRWWEQNKSKCIFQTDRLRIKTQNLLVPTFESYRALIGDRTQKEAFRQEAGTRGSDLTCKYRAAWDFALQIKNFGRFSLFIYLELIHELTSFKMTPDRLEVQQALSSRNGLCFALGIPEMMDRKLSETEANLLEWQFHSLLNEVSAFDDRATVWGLETVLCAFKKHCKGQRWVGYYLDRQHKEISKMQANVSDGVCWDVLWDYRNETYAWDQIIERTGKPSALAKPYVGHEKEW